MQAPSLDCGGCPIYDQLAPALDFCRALGSRAAPDCAQGAYHDYWFAVIVADEATLPDEGATDPRALCGAQPVVFVRPCWYRAFVDNRPAGPRPACYRWLGKALAVVTDGRFGEEGCPQLAAGAARSACRAGASSMEGALVTFSWVSPP